MGYRASDRDTVASGGLVRVWLVGVCARFGPIPFSVLVPSCDLSFPWPSSEVLSPPSQKNRPACRGRKSKGGCRWKKRKWGAMG
jgi:hypothetical protein